jgi:hypothetical protein
MRAQRRPTAPRARRRARPLAIEDLESRRLPTTFVVTNTGDLNGSGTPVPGSLRDAILQANAAPGADTIRFSIGTGVQTIAPTRALPTITGPVTIDGTSQPGFAGTPLIVISGQAAGPFGGDGLTITAGNSTVRGLVINNFFGNGLVLSGGGGNVIQGNFIGTDAAGAASQRNFRDGLLVLGSSNNTIGGTTPSARNLLSGNFGANLALAANGASPSSGNLVQGNFIGTDNTGAKAITPGGIDGGVIIAGGSNNTIGGTTPGAGNVISGNAGPGIVIDGTGSSPSSGNAVQGNAIGTNAAGSKALGNFGQGVEVVGASGNTIGGSSPSARNIISGNSRAGVEIDGPAATNNLIQGNDIGTDAAGGVALGNSGGGVVLGGDESDPSSGAANNTVAGNLISGNTFGGVTIQSGGSSGNVVVGNLIGTDGSGTKALGFGTFSGVQITSGAHNNTIGGPSAGARNVISGSAFSQVDIEGGMANVVQGNYLGTDLTGRTALGGGTAGAGLFGAEGGLVLGPGSQNNFVGNNLISGNIGDGISLLGDPQGTAAPTSGNVIQGNLIGTDVTGRAVLPGLPFSFFQPVGNLGAGISLVDASFNLIGGTTPGAGNVIAGNGSHGVAIQRSSGGANSNRVQGNAIGTDRTGAVNLGNAGSGVLIDGFNNQVGGLAAGAGNIIAFNARKGVSLSDGFGNAPGTGNTILNNAIFGQPFAQGGLGIDLNDDGPTAPGSQSPGIGANNLQNAPVLSQTTNSDGSVTVTGSLVSLANTSYTLQFYSNPPGDAEGQALLLTTTVATDGTGAARFQFRFAGASGRVITATATDPAGNTSEFSLPPGFQFPRVDLSVAITTGGPPSTPGLHAADSGSGMKTCTYTVTFSNNSTQAAPGVFVKSQLPAGTTLDKDNPPAPSTGRAVVNGNIITLEAGTLAPGASASLTITVDSNGTPGMLKPRAEVNGNPVDPNLNNNRAVTPICGMSPGDFDGDGKADVAIYDQTASQFFILLSGGGARTPQFGNPAHANIPLAGDFDGDGKTDFGIYDQTASQFFILLSGGGARTPQFGNPAHRNVPIAGDFDGDGKADFAVYDQTASQFFILLSGGGAATPQFGNPAHVNIPIAGDFNGDDKTDFAVYDQTASQFFILLSGGGAMTPQFGNPGHVNIPVAGDFDGDGKTDFGIYDQTQSQFFILLSGGGARTPQFGNPAHVNIPMAGDFDGDGKADIAIYDQTQSQFFVLLSGGGALTPQFGNPHDINIPVTGSSAGVRVAVACPESVAAPLDARPLSDSMGASVGPRTSTASASGPVGFASASLAPHGTGVGLLAATGARAPVRQLEDRAEPFGRSPAFGRGRPGRF